MIEKSTTVRAIQVAGRIGGRLAPALAARWLERMFITPRRLAAPAREIRWLAGASAGSLQLDDGRSLPVHSWGTGPTVLLVHGWSGRGSQMAGFAEPLVQRGFRVVAFDAPGHGGADGKRLGLPEMADVVTRVACEVGPVEAVVAHSLGAAATTIALSGPLSLNRVVYIASPENPGAYLYRIADFLGFGERVASRTQKRLEDRFGRPFSMARGRNLASRFETPLLLVHDRNDTDVPYREGQRLAKAWPGACLMTTEGLGHNRVLRDATVIEAVVDFLSPLTGPKAAVAEIHRPAALPANANGEIDAQEDA